MTTPKNRQIRMIITGGGADINEMSQIIKASMERNGLQSDEWDLSWEQAKSFGEHGPMRKITLGFTARS